MTSLTNSYLAGYNAQRAGKSLDDNPHQEGDPREADWRQGFRDGEQDSEHTTELRDLYDP